MSVDFIDRQTIDDRIDERFVQLVDGLAAYWQADGDEILAQAVGDDRLLSHQVRNKIRAITKTAKPDACVLLAVTDEPSPRLLLTKRSSQLNSHAGEVSLVGGKRDMSDISSWQVAMREAFEEVGLAQSSAQLLGFLPMQISKNGLLVRPVVACITSQSVDGLIANADEIDEIFWLDLAYLQTQPPKDYVLARQTDDGIYRLHTPAWVIWADGKEQIIWGLTGRILANFLQLGFGITYDWYYRLEPTVLR